ncbi:cytidine deaminase [candidate division WOR-3 bacterium]|nr:cytidine deaminase [candidate division WOR-3 bacterium]
MLPEEQDKDMSLPESGAKVPFEDFIVRDLSQAAYKAVHNSYSPYSGFAVGAAVLSGEGCIYTGTNIENSSFGLTICAERAAIAAAVTAGERVIRGIAVYTPTDEPTVPCGACLATIAEFRDPGFMEGDIPILLAGRYKERWTSLKALLPEVFKLNPKEKQ